VAVASAPDGVGSVAVHDWGADAELGPVVASVDLPSPTWLSWGPASGDRRLLHAGLEVDEGAVVTLAVPDEPAATVLEVLAHVPTGGAGPAHLAPTPDGRHLVAANYGDGSVGLVRLDGAGVADRLLDVVHHDGSGPVADRQSSAHPHQVVPDPTTGLVTVVDLGADLLATYRVHGDRLERVAGWSAPAGTGPRQLARVPGRDDAYVVGELSGALLHLRETSPGAFQLLGEQPASASAGDNPVAHTHLDAARGLLYVSNRGPDTIAVFDVGSGSPRRLAEVPTAAHPRHFGASAGWLLVGGMEADEVALHALGPDGVPAPARTVPARAPACVAPAAP
jgi:6-phosphogluconolactonase (cycloisomerase 2 family)